MTTLDAPAAAARRQHALDRMVEDLVGWGCPLEHAEPRARQLLDRVLDVGYSLPVALDGAPLTGHGSTPEGRARAREVFEAARRARHAAAAGGPGAPNRGGQVPQDPRNAPSATQGVER